MIRQITLILILASSSVCMAQPLYKWVESDGSITFSPSKPPAGVDFEIVSPASEAPPKIAAAVQAPRNSQLIDNSSAPAYPALQASDSQASNASVTANSLNQRTNTSANNPIGSISADTSNTNPNIPVDTGITMATATPTQLANHKQSRCQDLQKRVVSLERRLRSRLTPEDMDNTVIHMARYQRSFDQHCVQ